MPFSFYVRRSAAAEGVPAVPAGPFGHLPFDTVCVADTETTGLFPFGPADGSDAGPWGCDRLCSAAFVVFSRHGSGWRRGDAMSITVDPGRPVPENAAKVNGFHWSGDGTPAPDGRTDLAGRPGFAEAAGRLLGFTEGLPLVFHNSVFDAAVLDAELERAGFPPISVPVICTKKAFADLQGLGRPEVYLPGTNLNALCDRLGVSRAGRTGPDGKELHGAEVDAVMAGECFSRLEPLGWVLAEAPASLPHRRNGLSVFTAGASSQACGRMP